MNYIVIDFEFNAPFSIDKTTRQLKGSNPLKDLPYEIIEIGAVKLNSKLNIIDEYESFVKPCLYRKLQPIVIRKTKISQNQIKFARTFPFVFQDFKKWMGKNYILMSWSQSDILALNRSLKYHFPEYRFDNRYIDVQKAYQLQNNYDKQPSLKNVCEDLNIKTGQIHRAKNDAIATAKILKHTSLNISTWTRTSDINNSYL